MEIDFQTNYKRYRRYFKDVARFYANKKVKAYTEAVLTIFTVAFFLAFAIRPTLITIASLVKEIKEKKEVSLSLQRKINDLSLAQQNYQAAEKNLYLIDQSLPLNPFLNELIRQIEVLALKDEVKIDTFQFSNVEIKKNKPSEKKEIEFNLVVSGEYQNIKNFLKDLTNLRRLISFDNFIIKQTKKEASTLVLSLSGKAFFMEKK